MWRALKYARGKKARLYHGAKRWFAQFRTPTGRDELDVLHGGVVYLTSDADVARRYGGWVAEVD